jgi:nicotinamide riboside transporter PnuC
MRILSAAFLVGHGLVHGVMWALPYSEEALADLPMDPGHSWILGDARAVGLGLALATTIVFVTATVAMLADAPWWPPFTIAAAGLSAVLLTLFFSTWWLIGFAIDIAVVVVAARSL